VSYVCPDSQWFQLFPDLPAELRETVVYGCLLVERDAGRLSKHLHFDEFNNPCYKWYYPKVLVAYGNQGTKVFTKFLKAIPGGGGKNAVKHLNFPQTHWFDHLHASPTGTNPSLELAVACKKLHKLDMTFHVDKVTICNKTTDRER
jgi:hypothetical protein